MSQLLQKFRRDIIGLIWLATGIFLGLALFSYHPSDPSFNTIGGALKAKNYCGYFGSFLSDLLYQGLGLSSWVLVIGSFRMSFLSFLGRNQNRDRLRVLWQALLIITVSCMLGLYFPKMTLYSNQVHAGGVIGLLVSQSLMKVFNFWGVGVILWTLVGVLAVFYTERALGELLTWPVKLLAPVKDALASFWQNQIREGFFEKCVSVWRARSPGTEMAIAGAPQTNTALPSVKFFLKGHRETSSEKTPSNFFRIDGALAEEEPDGQMAMSTDSDEEDIEDEVKPSRRPRLSGFLLRQGDEKKKTSKKLMAKASRRIENWELPKIDLLQDAPNSRYKVDQKEIKEKADLLVDKLSQFSVKGEVVGVKPGPAVTLFEFKPAADVKISKITELADDLSLALSSESVRIIAPIPGRNVVGIETSNSNRETVYLKDIVQQESFWKEDVKLPVAMGRKGDGEPTVVDLRKMPHLLVAGSTGSGKSVFVVSILTGLLFRHSPKTLRLILVDPKQVDLAAFGQLPHLLMPPIRDPKKAVSALRWGIKEMEKRYRSMSKFGARGIESFNKIVEKLTKEEIEKHAEANDELDYHNSYYFTPQPFIAIVIEEFGDLMAVDKSNVEQAVVRLAQMARACGIHLILAMQSPRKDVVTGLIKTNIPGRISFKVASKMDSRIILDEAGAERLLARGDMLFLAPGVAKPIRHHGAYLDEFEIDSVTDYWEEQGEPEFDPLAMKALEGNGGGFDLDGGSDEDSEEEDYDERYDEILEYISTLKTISASHIQRRFRLGYPRAARLIEVLESEGVIGPANGSKPRPVLVNPIE